MTAKISAARRRAFLKAVAETGNQTLAAERAKVSRSWVTLHRSRDAAFDAAIKRIEADMLRGGIAACSGETPAIGSCVREMSANEAFYLYEMHQRRLYGGRRAPAGRLPTRPMQLRAVAQAVEATMTQAVGPDWRARLKAVG